MTGQSATRWWVLFFLCIAIGGNYYEYDAIAPIADFLRTQRNFTQSQIGMLNAVLAMAWSRAGKPQPPSPGAL